VKTYEVESEVLYLFAVQAANETDARHFAEYSLAKGEASVRDDIVSVVADE
jgi:hypothetical protein